MIVFVVMRVTGDQQNNKKWNGGRTVSIYYIHLGSVHRGETTKGVLTPGLTTFSARQHHILHIPGRLVIINMDRVVKVMNLS